VQPELLDGIMDAIADQPSVARAVTSDMAYQFLQIMSCTWREPNAHASALPDR
jgi:hypothetical protein